MADIYKKIDDKFKELQPLYDRMDEDLDIYNLEAYKLKDYDGKEAKRVDNVTLNDPFVFAQRVMSVINSSEMVLKVIGAVNDEQVSAIKSILGYSTREADKFLKLKRLGRLRNNLVKIAGMRGIGGIRPILWKDKEGNLYFDYLPLDTRYCAWEYGFKGLLWGAYQTERSKDAIEQEYQKVVAGKTGKITEYFDDESHIVFTNKDKVKEEENTLGFNPMFIAPIGMAMVLKKPTTTDAIKYEGDSIYVANRQVYKDMNKLATIAMTTAAFGFRPPLQIVTPPGAEITEAPEGAKQPYTGGASLVEMGYSRIEAMPLKDLSASLPYILGEFSARRQRGSFPDVEFGEIRYPLSAVAIAKLTEGRNQIFEPIIAFLVDAYEFVFDKTIKQILNEGLEIGDFDTSLLVGNYAVEVEFHPTSPEENISRYSIAAAARGFLDSDTIRTSVLKIKDEGQVQKNLDTEFAELAVPELRLYRVAKELAEQGRDMEAQIILKRIGLALAPPEAEGRPEEEMSPEMETPIPPLMPGTAEESASEAEMLRTELGSKGLMPKERTR